MQFSPHSRISSAGSIASSRKILTPSQFRKRFQGTASCSISGRSNQSAQIIAKSDHYVVENYGNPLPVLVNEALTFSERNINVSVKYSINGWAWAVCGRRLIIWQYKDQTLSSFGSDNTRTPQRRTAANQCRELTLPHCDIGHKASLVDVFLNETQQMPSCLSISPTGDVRFWPSIAHDGSSIDEAGILDGQEFEEILRISNQGYILATTTCSLVHLQLQIQGGRHVINHKAIKTPSGFFGGIGKKFASIIIGMNHGNEKENKLLKVCADKHKNNDWYVTVLADRWIQRWLFSSNSAEQFVYDDHEIIRKIRETFHTNLWNNRDINEIEVWMLDMQIHESNVIILAAGLNLQHTPQIHYALFTLIDHTDHTMVQTFSYMKHTVFYSQENSSEYFGWKFIVSRNVAFVYSDRAIYPVYLSGANNEEMDKIEFQVQDDQILTASSFNNLPLFFSKMYGIVCVTPSDFEPEDMFNNSTMSDVFSPLNNDVAQNTSIFTAGAQATIDNNLGLYDLDPEEMVNENKDVASQLKAAFVYHLKKNTSNCSSILKELFPENVEIMEADSLLDKTVLRIVIDLAEDVPATDPRWEHEEYKQKQALGSSSSLQIIQQLREKSLALNHFINFLHSTKLWNRLRAVTYKGVLKSTCHFLSDIHEKIVAAITLRSIHNQYTKLIDTAIERVLNEWNQPMKQNLMQQDLFYVRPTQIQDFFKVLVKIVEEEIQKEYINLKISQLIIEINSILLYVLKKVSEVRDPKSVTLSPSAEKKHKYEYLPWTATSGKNGLKDTIQSMIDITLKHGARSIGESDIRQQHYVHLFELIDFLLDGRRSYLESIKDNEKYRVLLNQYESQRSEIIFQLLEDEQYEFAAKLGEKYFDFQTLVVLCDRTKNQRRLDEYIERFKDKNFSQYAIQWHIKQNKKGDLFKRFKDNQNELSRFLCDHPSLAWIQSVFNGNFEDASLTLFNLALKETELVARKKTILSLSKLAALASEVDMNNQIDEINTSLSIIEHQEQLPIGLLAAFGIDINNPKVLTPDEIINLYIDVENEAATEMEFRKALELIKFVENPLEARHKIWCAIILRDSWSYYDVNSPLNDVQNTLFMKLVDISYLIDGNVFEYLPSIEDFLNADELEALIHKKSFQFLFKLAYEYIFDNYKNK